MVERSEQPTIKLEVAAAEQQHLPAAADALSDYFNAAAAALPSSLPPAAPTTSSPLATDSEDGEALRVTIDSKERLRWSPQLHQRFCKAVAELGGSAVAKVSARAAHLPTQQPCIPSIRPGRHPVCPPVRSGLRQPPQGAMRPLLLLTGWRG